MHITHSDEVVGKNSNALSLELSEHWHFENDVYFLPEFRSVGFNV